MKPSLKPLILKTIMMKIYFARPISNYKTPQDERDLSDLKKLGFEVLNPDKETLSKRYEKEGMSAFIEAVNECDALAFRASTGMKITAGVAKEINAALDEGKPVIELPTIYSDRVMSVDDTRAFLRYSGKR